MKPNLDITLNNNRSSYLNNISTLIKVPALKANYRANASYIDYVTNGSMKPVNYACPKCLLLPNETIFRKSIQPQQQKLLKLKYERKNNLTLYQIRDNKKMQRYKQQLIVKCSTCSNIVKLPLPKPQKDKRVVSIAQTPNKKKKKKRKKNRFAGINQDAVTQAQQIFQTPATTKDFISLQLTPTPQKQLSKRKIDEVIVLGDSPLPVAKKAKKSQTKDEVITVQDSSAVGRKLNNQIEQVMQGFKPAEIIQIQDSPTPKKAKTHLQQMMEKSKLNQPSKKNIQAMKQQAKDIEEARKALEPLPTKKEKKKMKHKLKKISDTIKNFEHQNEKRSTLQSFLSSMFA